MRSILITGGSGSFGQAFTEMLLRFSDHERICVYSRDEVKQAEMRAKFNDDSRLRFFIGDVRDMQRLERACSGVDVVIHAAALKRIEVGHYNPDEMIKTNVLGSMNVLEAARQQGVERIVYLSTDKACEPISAYGKTKALAEDLFLNANHGRGEWGPKCAVTRYGNVAFSRGSVIPKWRAQIAAGERINVTQPSATRFYMTMEQACNLVYRTMYDMPEKVVVPRLPAYRLADLAEALGAYDYKVIGLPAWEKLHEKMQPHKSSEDARRLTVAQLRKKIAKDGKQ